MKIKLVLLILMMCGVGCAQQSKQTNFDMQQSISKAGFSVYKKSVSPEKKSYQRPDLVLTGKYNFSDMRYDARFGLVVENAGQILGDQRIYDCLSLKLGNCDPFTSVKKHLDELISNNLATLIKSIASSATNSIIPSAETITFDIFFNAQHNKKIAAFSANAAIVYKTVESSGPMRVMTITFPIKEVRKNSSKWHELSQEKIIKLFGSRKVFWEQYRIMDRANYLHTKT